MPVNFLTLFPHFLLRYCATDEIIEIRSSPQPLRSGVGSRRVQRRSRYYCGHLFGTSPAGNIKENYAALLRETGRNADASAMEARAKAIRAKHALDNPVQ